MRQTYSWNRKQWYQTAGMSLRSPVASAHRKWPHCSVDWEIPWCVNGSIIRNNTEKQKQKQKTRGWSCGVKEVLFRLSRSSWGSNAKSRCSPGNLYRPRTNPKETACRKRCRAAEYRRSSRTPSRFMNKIQEAPGMPMDLDALKIYARAIIPCAEKTMDGMKSD